MAEVVLVLVVVLFVLLAILAGVTVVGHGIWVFVAWVFRAARGGPRSQEQREPCVFCGRLQSVAEARCGWCGRDLRGPPAAELADLKVCERQLVRLVKAGALSPQEGSQLQGKLSEYRTLWLEAPAKAVPEARPAALPAAPTTPRQPAKKPPAKPAALPTAGPDAAAETIIMADVAEVVAKPPAAVVPAKPQAAVVPAKPQAVAPKAKPQAATPRKSLGEMLAAFMEERNIRWGELIGGLLIVGSSVALVLSLWDTLKDIRYFPFLIFVTVSSAIFGVGLYAHHRWKLESTSRALMLIATLLVPLNFLFMASLAQGQRDTLTLVMEVAALGVFALLVALTGRVLVERAQWLQVLAVVGNSAAVPWIQRLLGPESPPSAYLLAGCLPVACFAAAVGGHLLQPGQAGRGASWAASRLTLLGTAAFAMVIALGLLITRAENISAVLDELSIPLALAGTTGLACGLTVMRGVAREASLAAWHVAALVVALVGMAAMLTALGLAWPHPLAMIAVAALDAAVLAAAAFWGRLPPLHAVAAACAALAYLTGFHVIFNDLPLWSGEESLGPEMFRLLIGGSSGTALVGLFLIFAAISEFLVRRGHRDDGRVYAAACGVMAVFGLVLVTAHGLWYRVQADALRAAALYGIYGAGSLALTARWRRAELSYVGLGLLAAAPLWALWWHPQTHQVAPLWAAVLAGEALAFGIVAALLRQFSSNAEDRLAAAGTAAIAPDGNPAPTFRRRLNQDLIDLYRLPLLHLAEILAPVALLLGTATAWLDRASIAAEHSSAPIVTTICLAALYLLMAWQYRSPARTWAGSLIALAGLIHTLAFNYTLWAAQPWLVALLTHATAAVLAGIALDEWGRRRAGETLAGAIHRVFSRPLAQTALLSSALALPVLLWTNWAELWSLAGCLYWLAAIWLIIAWRHRNAPLLAAHQLIVILATAVATTAWLKDRQWMEDLSADLLRPWNLQAYAFTLGLLALLWTAGRIALRRNAVAERLLNPGWPSVDWLLRHALVWAYWLPIVVYLFPGIGEELLDVLKLGGNFPAQQAAACGGGAWLVWTVLAAMLIVALWERWRPAELFSTLLLVAAAAWLIAGRCAGDFATASAARWTMSFAFVLCSLAVWGRRHLSLWCRQMRMNIEPGPLGPMIARATLLATTAVPVLLITLLAALMQFAKATPGGPAVDSFFELIRPEVSYLVPLMLVLVGLVGYALRERSAGYAFSGGLVAEMIVTLGYCLRIVLDPSRSFGTAELVTVVQLATITAAVWALIWLVLRRQLDVWREPLPGAATIVAVLADVPSAAKQADPAAAVTFSGRRSGGQGPFSGRRDGGLTATLLMGLQIGMGTAGNALLIVVAIFALTLLPLDWQNWTVAAGGPLGWIALALVVAAAAYRRMQQGRQLGVNTVGLIGMTTLALQACSIRALLPEWGYGAEWGYRTLMLGWAAYALFIVCAMWWVATLRTLPGAQGPPQVLLRAAAVWVRIAGLLAVLLGLKAAVFHEDWQELLWAAAAISIASGAGAAMAVWRRREGWAFSAALGTNLAASLVVWYFHREAASFADWWLRLVQANVIASAAVALVWLAAHRRLYQLRELRVRSSPLLALQVALPAIGNVALLIVPVLWLLQVPQYLPESLSRLADLPGWLALVLTAAAAAWYLRQVLPGGLVHVFGALLLGAGVLAACAVGQFNDRSSGSDWLAYHMLLTAWAIAGVVTLGLGLLGSAAVSAAAQRAGCPRSELRGGAIFSRRVGVAVELPPQRFAGPLVQGWVTLIGALTLLFALTHCQADAPEGWWSIRAVLTVSFTAGMLAMWLRLPAYVYVSGLLVNVAGVIAWLAWGPDTAYSLLQANVVCLAIGSAIWTVLQPAHPAGVPHPGLSGRALPFAHLAAAVAVGLVIAVVGGGVAGTIVPELPLHLHVDLWAWIMLAAAAAAVVLCLWDRQARFPLAGLYLLALAAIEMAACALELSPREFCWKSICELAGLMLAAAVAGWLLPRLRAVWRILMIPDGPGRWPVAWFLHLQAVLTLVAAALTAWVAIDFDFDGVGQQLAWFGWAGRLPGSPAALMLIGGAIVMAWQTDGRWRRGWQCAAFLAGVLLGSSIGWARLDAAAGTPTGDAPWLHRCVVLMVSAAMMTLLSSFGLRLALPHRSDWLTTGRRIAPALGGLALVMLAVVLEHEGFACYTAGSVPMAAWAIAVVAVALIGLVAACLGFAVVPQWEPWGLSDRGRTAYVYAAEVLLVLLGVHIRLTMPWLFNLGLVRHYWMLIVMAVAFCGAGLSALFHRRNMPVLSEPLERTALLLPLAAAVGYWFVQPTDAATFFLGDASPAAWLLMGLFYGVMAAGRRSIALAALAILTGNMGLWVLWHRCGLAFLDRPQLWLIPVALAVLAAEHLDRGRLSQAQRTALRYLALSVIYVSSTTEFWRGIDTVILPLVTIVLAVLGVLAGILLRVRSFLYLGFAFLLVVIGRMIEYAAFEKQHIWVFWTCCILLGAAIIALFAVFEKRRNDILAAMERFKQWQR